MRSRVMTALSLSLILSVSSFLVISYGNATNKGGVFTFAVYYGSAINKKVIDYLNSFNMVILEPWAFNTSELAHIRAIKIAYIDLGEFDNGSSCCKVNVSAVEIGYDSMWGQPVVNASSPIWQQYIMCEVNSVMKKGFQGVLFDDIDVAEQYPSVSHGIITIIKDVRQLYPAAVIGVNRGFVIFQNVSPYINFIMYEDYGTQVVGPGQIAFVQNTNRIYSLTETIRHYNVTLIALAYAQYPGDVYYSYASYLACAEGVPIYITNWDATATWPQSCPVSHKPLPVFR
ncbi:MAG: hypothetical protein ACP5LF_06595 [Nitrososphaeria archaeon]